MLTISRIKELCQTQVDWQLELYSGAHHAFTTPDSPANDRAGGGNAEIFCRSLQELKQCAQDGRCSWAAYGELKAYNNFPKIVYYWTAIPTHWRTFSSRIELRYEIFGRWAYQPTHFGGS